LRLHPISRLHTWVAHLRPHPETTPRAPALGSLTNTRIGCLSSPLATRRRLRSGRTDPTNQTKRLFRPESPIDPIPTANGRRNNTERRNRRRQQDRWLMRRAILQELCEPLDPAEPPPAYKLQAVVHAVVDKAAQGDLTAAKEILDRIDGKMSPTPAPAAPGTPSLHGNPPA
jgi:hypothetical protein